MFKRELRLVITEDCNYNCVFCHKEGMKKYERCRLDSSDYAYLYKVCKEQYGWNEITLTGGEPFIRKDVDDIIEKLYNENAKITIVTNGELLNNHERVLKYVDRINLSIHTLDKDKYDEIVQRKNKLQEVLKNISVIRNMYPNLNIRLNMVIIRGENDDEEQIKEYIEFARRINASIKFVELFSKEKDKIVTIDEMAEKLKNIGFKYNGICNVSKQELTDGEVQIVLSRIFCANAIEQIDPEGYCNKYNDLFITPEGNTNICRNTKEDISIFEEVKSRDERGLIDKLNKALDNIGKNCVLCREDKKLAINGGKPIFSNKEEAKFIHPKIDKNIENAVLDQLHRSISIYDNSGIFGEFEENFAKYHNRKYALTFSSGTAALWAMYDSIGLKKGDEVICPCYTFFATATPILFTGATPVLVDCGKDGNIDPEKVKEKINEKTKAIVVTHMWGYPCDMKTLRKIADEYNLYLLEDCSHAHGAKIDGKPCGAWGDVAAFSLQGQKIITGGEGGVLITDDKNIKENALLLGHYNKRCKVEISRDNELYDYFVTGKGMKLRAHPIAIRIANEYFKDIDNINAKKHEYANLIIKELEGIEGIEILKEKENANNSWYAIIFKYDSSKMCGVSLERFVEAVKAEGAIEIDIPGSTCPLNELKLFENPEKLFPESNFSYKDETFENAKEFYNSIFKLPMWYTDEEMPVVIKYIRAIKKVCNNIKELI